MLHRKSHLGLCLLALGTFACSDSASSATDCSVRFGGNTADWADLDGACATLAAAADAGLTISLQASTKQIAQLSVSIDLGDQPETGVYSSEMSGSWNAVGAFADRPDCVFTAGDDLVPSGSYTLTIDTIDAAPGGRAHGTLELSAYVHAPPAIDCGAGDNEDVVLQF